MWAPDGAGTDTFEARAARSSGDASRRPALWPLANHARLGDGRGMFADKRRIAVAFCAIGAFLHLYAPQSVLPMMAQEYGAGAADASLVITAGTLAVAATAPFA